VERHLHSSSIQAQVACTALSGRWHVATARHTSGDAWLVWQLHAVSQTSAVHL
jgi:hypothetical protein